MKNSIKKLGLSILVASSLYAEAPTTINYQGYLTDSSSNAVSGSKNIVFKIYNAGGTELWSSGTKAITVTDGVYSTVLGDTTALTGLAFDTQYYLGITVESDSEMSPRQPLTSVAYSIKSKTTEQIGTLTDGKWCDNNGTAINCEQPAPMLKTTYDITGDGKIDANKINGSSTNGQVLTTDGSGAVSWQMPSGGITITRNSASASDTAYVACTGSGKAIGGGCTSSTEINQIYVNCPATSATTCTATNPTGWYCDITNEASVTAYVICAE